MTIIADSGSTKTDWCLFSEAGRVYFTTVGLNPFFLPPSQLHATVRKAIASAVDADAVKAVHFYGAGINDRNVPDMVEGLQQVFPAAETIQVQMDLLGAALALLGDKPGFAAILGTGTNSGIYDGRSITYHIDSLGFLLGDEGSGAAIGKQILVDFLRRRLPVNLHNAFVREYGDDTEELINSLYKSAQPNRFCAQYAKFLDVPDMDSNYRHEVVHRNFRAFFSQLVCLYPAYGTHRFNCVGSIAYRFRDILEEEALYHGMKMGKVLRSVIEELANYHENKTVIS